MCKKWSIYFLPVTRVHCVILLWTVLYCYRTAEKASINSSIEHTNACRKHINFVAVELSATLNVFSRFVVTRPIIYVWFTPLSNFQSVSVALYVSGLSPTSKPIRILKSCDASFNRFARLRSHCIQLFAKCREKCDWAVVCRSSVHYMDSNEQRRNSNAWK